MIAPSSSTAWLSDTGIYLGESVQKASRGLHQELGISLLANQTSTETFPQQVLLVQQNQVQI